MVYIDKFDFEVKSIEDIRSIRHYNTMVGENWPVVYVLNNEEEAYVGETVNAARRTEQHLASGGKQDLISDSHDERDQRHLRLCLRPGSQGVSDTVHS